MIDFYDLLVIRSALEDYYETLWLDFQLSQCKRAIDHVKEEINNYQDNLSMKWTPCIDKEPDEEHKLYLITKKTPTDFYFTTRSYFFSKEVGWSDTGVVAWMPMPEPYKKEGEAE